MKGERKAGSFMSEFASAYCALKLLGETNCKRDVVENIHKGNLEESSTIFDDIVAEVEGLERACRDFYGCCSC